MMSNFKYLEKKNSWTTWILLQEVQLKIWRQITKNCLYVFQLVFFFWRLSRYESGRPGIDSNNKHYMPSCMSKYRFFRAWISNLMSKFSWTALILLQEVQLQRQINKYCLYVFKLLDFFCNKDKLIYLNRILSFEGILGLIWRLSRYGLGRPGIDSNYKHYMPSCMSKYRFLGS